MYKKNKDEQTSGIKPDPLTENETLLEQRAKKVVSDSLGLVDFAIRLARRASEVFWEIQITEEL